MKIEFLCRSYTIVIFRFPPEDIFSHYFAYMISFTRIIAAIFMLRRIYNSILLSHFELNIDFADTYIWAASLTGLIISIFSLYDHFARALVRFRRVLGFARAHDCDYFLITTWRRQDFIFPSRIWYFGCRAISADLAILAGDCFGMRRFIYSAIRMRSCQDLTPSSTCCRLKRRRWSRRHWAFIILVSIMWLYMTIA